MNPLMAGGLIGAGLGVGKYFLEDLPNQRAQAELQARTAELSPWTGLRPQQVKPASMMGNLMKFGGTGLSMGQGYGQMQQQNKMLDAYKQAQLQSNPWSIA